jgi:hypothetical protein
LRKPSGGEFDGESVKSFALHLTDGQRRIADVIPNVDSFSGGSGSVLFPLYDHDVVVKLGHVGRDRVVPVERGKVKFEEKWQKAMV